MRAVIIDGPGNIRVGSVPDPTPKPDEVVIRVGACGICGTDLHNYWLNGGPLLISSSTRSDQQAGIKKGT